MYFQTSQFDQIHSKILITVLRSQMLEKTSTHGYGFYFNYFIDKSAWDLNSVLVYEFAYYVFTSMID